MIIRLPCLAATAMVLILPAAAAVVTQPLRALAEGDQVPTTLVAAPLSGQDSERAPLSFAWALDPAMPLQTAGPSASISHSYWLQVEGRQLRSGLNVPLTAPGAVVQLSPVPGARALPADEVDLYDPAGHGSVARRIDARPLQEAGWPTHDGSSLLRSGATSAAGAYTLRSARAQGRYVVQVLEPDSPIRLDVQVSPSWVLAGGQVRLQARLLAEEAGAAPVPAHHAGLVGEALLVAPDGRSWRHRLLRGDDGSLGAQVRVPADTGTAPGLWELQVFTQADGVLRDGRVAFAAARPTARFTGKAMTDAHSRQVGLSLAVMSAGRYEVRGTLHATAGDGRLRPVARAHAAAWFDGAKHGVLTLPFDQVPLPVGFGPPYELRDLQLQDQTRMALVESRAVALGFPEAQAAGNMPGHGTALNRLPPTRHSRSVGRSARRP